MMKKSLVALAFGTLGLGVAEFVMMGILPQTASGLGIDIPTAGHFISAYALGVCCGAPILVFARRYPLKKILLGLAALIVAGNLCAAASPDYATLMIARFISGLPHGAYFGVGSIVAEKLADEGHGTQAVSIMIAGMTVANLFGVPLGTLLSTMLSWRLTFLLVGIWGVAIIWFIRRWIPDVGSLPDTGFKGQFRFFATPAPWLILGATALGNGGIFCWYSYINPMLTEISGFRPQMITPLMILAGAGMVAGNLSSGRLSDRHTPSLVGMSSQAMICIALLAIFLLAQHKAAAVVLMCICTAGLFAVSGPEQVLIIRVARGGEMLGAATVQIAFNLGNAVGAYAGGAAAGCGYEYPALAGVPFALTGFALFLAFHRRYGASVANGPLPPQS